MKRLFAQVRAPLPHLLAKAQYAFRDERLPELLFRYRAQLAGQPVAGQ